jgi:hypothetical protein
VRAFYCGCKGLLYCCFLCFFSPEKDFGRVLHDSPDFPVAGIGGEDELYDHGDVPLAFAVPYNRAVARKL